MTGDKIDFPLHRIAAKATKTGPQLHLYGKESEDPFISFQLTNDAALAIADALVKATLASIKTGERK